LDRCVKQICNEVNKRKARLHRQRG
jgi:hypothetical protein